MEKKSFTKENIRVSVKLIRQLSTTFYPKIRMIFDELVSNARDAMASNVWIETTKEDIVVRDDGEGMNHDDLVKFFYISHTNKLESPIKMRGDIKRYIIGRFGIGKLSLYQICNRFRIETFKDGEKSWAEFDFKKLEDREYLDEVELFVHSAPAPGNPSGTTITLLDLNKKRYRGLQADNLMKGLAKSLRPDPNFNIFVNDNKAKSDKLEGSCHEITEDDYLYKTKDKKVHNIGNLGEITGQIYYTKDPLKPDEAGVYVRVFGRVVNENPRIIDLSSLRSPKALSRRTLVDIDANFLADALMTNRNGFIEDDPKYMKFIEWLRYTLNQYNEKEVDDYKKRTQDEETMVIPELVSQDLDRITRREGLGKYGVKIMDLGISQPECIIDDETKVVIINRLHPMYIRARKEYVLDYHALRAAIIQFALKGTKSIEEFKKKYNRMVLLE